jgi:dihydroorotase
MNPPLREEEDRRAIIEGLKDGTIDIIATDHAPHSQEEKDKPITEAPSGIIGLETALSLGVTNLVATGELTYDRLIECMSLNPARMYKLKAGTLSAEAAADIVVFNPDETYIAGDYASKSANSPFTGMELKGKVKYTLVGGKVVYRD